MSSKKQKRIRPLSKDITPMFTVREQGDHFIHTLTSTSQTKEAIAQRRDVSQRVPSILREKRNLTADELQSVGWTQVGRKPHYLEVDVDGKLIYFPFLQFLDEEQIHESKLWRKFTRMQEIAVQPAFQRRLKEVTKLKDATYELSFSVQPGNNRQKAIQLSRTGNVDDVEFHELRELVAETANQIILSCFPDLAAMLKRRWCLDASLTVGCEDNWTISGLQMNFTTLNEIEEENGMSESLGDFSGLHMDGLDDPARVTVILNLSHLPKTHFPGRFNITTARITVPTAPFTAVIFRGTHPHFATGFGPYDKDIPVGSLYRYRPTGDVQLPILPEGTPYCRIVPVGYPKEVLANPRQRHLQDDLWSEQAVYTFGTRRALQEWLMRLYLKEKFLSRDKTQYQMEKERFEKSNKNGEKVGVDICDDFTYVDDVKEGDKDGELHIPRAWVAKAMFAWYGDRDVEWEDAKGAAGLVSIGKRYVSSQTGGQIKNGTVIWTYGGDDAVLARAAKALNPGLFSRPSRRSSFSSRSTRNSSSASYAGGIQAMTTVNGVSQFNHGLAFSPSQTHARTDLSTRSSARPKSGTPKGI